MFVKDSGSQSVGGELAFLASVRMVLLRPLYHRPPFGGAGHRMSVKEKKLLKITSSFP